jgi:hypothetical protein
LELVVLFFLIGLVPLISHLLLPIRFLLNFVDTVFDHGEGLSDFEVFHILLVVQFIGKF